jgi:hypothetical protein
MIRRAAIIAFTVFELIWLNVIIPGHTRGSVTMPCCSCETHTSADSCPMCAAKKAGPRTPTPADREHCALCFFAAHLSIPPTIDLSAPKLRFLNYVRPEVAMHLIAREVLVPFDGRGPPDVA